MRKLAPMILISSIAFAGAAFAADTDKLGNPTVSPNTMNTQGMSHADKSNMSTGTNAVMTEEDKAKADADHAKKKAMKSTKHMNKTDKAYKTVPAETTTMGTTSTAPAPVTQGDTAGITPAIRDNSTTGKNGQ